MEEKGKRERRIRRNNEKINKYDKSILCAMWKCPAPCYVQFNIC
jgi:hypothetical protein